MRLYYFTGAQYAVSNIALRRIKVSRYRDLNDPFELLGVNLSEKSNRETFLAIKRKIDATQGLVCFSKGWKNPLLWGHYAEKHTGIALGFDVPQHLARPVIYAKKLADVKIGPDGLWENDFIDQLVRTKFYDWKYEQEVRLSVTLDQHTESGLHFEPFGEQLSLREVILGPKCELPTASIGQLVSSFTPKVQVIKARIAFTRFEVLVDKAADLADKDI